MFLASLTSVHFAGNMTNFQSAVFKYGWVEGQSPKRKSQRLSQHRQINFILNKNTLLKLCI
jgi:hypothetical protein